MYTKRIHNNLKRYRRITGYSQNEIATILGIKYTATISKWEKGLLYPNLSHLFVLSALYNTTSQDLYSDLWHEKCSIVAVMKSRGKLKKAAIIHNEYFFL